LRINTCLPDQPVTGFLQKRSRMPVRQLRSYLEDGTVVDEFALLRAEVTRATQILRIDVGISRRGVRKARAHRRAAPARNVLQMGNVLRVLLFEQELLYVALKVRVERVGKSPHRSIGKLFPLDRQRGRRQTMIFNAEPEVVTQGEAGHQRIAIHAIGRKMQTRTRPEWRGRVGRQVDRIPANRGVLTDGRQDRGVVNLIRRYATSLQAVLRGNALFREHFNQRSNLVRRVDALVEQRKSCSHLVS
jgi:hypothetical protein